MKALEYTPWQNFNKVIKHAIIACRESHYNASEHFIEVNKMIKIAKGTNRIIQDYKLSCYACYLIALNADSKKEVVTLAQTYFAIQSSKSLKELEKEKLLN